MSFQRRLVRDSHERSLREKNVILKASLRNKGRHLFGKRSQRRIKPACQAFQRCTEFLRAALDRRKILHHQQHGGERSRHHHAFLLRRRKLNGEFACGFEWRIRRAGQTNCRDAVLLTQQRGGPHGLRRAAGTGNHHRLQIASARQVQRGKQHDLRRGNGARRLTGKNMPRSGHRLRQVKTGAAAHEQPLAARSGLIQEGLQHSGWT